MTLTVEEQKALDYLAQEKRREAFQRFLHSKLVAPVEPGATVKKGWAPLTNTGSIRGQSA